MLLKNTYPSQVSEMEEEPGVAIIKLVKSYALGGPDDGTVILYEVRPQPVEAGMHIDSFYLATFDDQNLELAWGIGNDPKEALETAALKWDRKVEEEEENPFKKAMNELKEGE